MKNIKTYEEFEKGITIEEYSKTIENFDDIQLKINGKDIISLKGIEKFTKLEMFSCGVNLLTSLEGIENSTTLTYLNCNYNKITSLKGIENLINLQQLHCRFNPIDWVDYIDKQGNKWYIELPKSIDFLDSEKFKTFIDYWEFMDKNQPATISRKFNF